MLSLCIVRTQGWSPRKQVASEQCRCERLVQFMQVSLRSLYNSCTPWPRLKLIHLMRFFSSWAALRSGYLRLQAFQQV